MTLAAIVLALVAGAFYMFRDKNTPVASVAQPPVTAQVIPAAPGRLGINAFPWANVTSIRNVDNGESIELAAGFVTPAPIDLAPGKYEVTLANPNFRRSITKTVDVRAGQDELLFVQFTESATLPQLAEGTR